MLSAYDPCETGSKNVLGCILLITHIESQSVYQTHGIHYILFAIFQLSEDES